MSLPLVRHTIRANRVRLVAVSVGLFAWGLFMPIIYSQFGSTFRNLVESGVIPEAVTKFGGGDIFTLPGSIALGFIHPIAIILTGIFSVGFGTAAVAGDRQRGTLEVLLSKPVSRRRVYLTLLACGIAFLAIAVAAYLLGTYAAASAFGVIGDIDTSRYPLAWANGLLLFGSFATISLAASVSFDRLGPAIGVTLVILLISYFFEVLGSLWPDAEPLRPWSLFHYLQTREVFTGAADPFAFALLAVVAAVAIAYALVVFPRRDIAAPA